MNKDTAIKLCTIGDLDKPFHRPECECKYCEEWRKINNRLTHEEMRLIIAQGK